MRRFGFLFFVSAVWLVASPATAKADAGGSPPRCTEQIAQSATIEAINRDFDSWRGKCVVIEAIYAWGELFADRRALLDDEHPLSETIASSRTLPIQYSKERPLPGRRPQRMKAIGTLGSCRDAYDVLHALEAQEPDQIIMLSGLCHYTVENYLVPAKLVPFGPTEFRLTEAEVPLERRKLQLLSPDRVGAAASFAGAAREALDALVAGDRDRFRKVGFAELDELLGARRAGEPLEGLEEDLEEVDRNFKTTLKRNAFLSGFDRLAAQERIFAEADDGGIADLDQVTLCWCKGRDCEGKWPVAPRDADNDPSRPYFCIEAMHYAVFPRGTLVIAEVPAANNGFPEPEWR